MSVFLPCTYILTHAIPATHRHLAAEMNTKKGIKDEGFRKKQKQNVHTYFHFLGQA